MQPPMNVTAYMAYHYQLNTQSAYESVSLGLWVAVI